MANEGGVHRFCERWLVANGSGFLGRAVLQIAPYCSARRAGEGKGLFGPVGREWMLYGSSFEGFYR